MLLSSELRFLRKSRPSMETMTSLFCFLFLIGIEVDSKSISDLLSEMELIDSNLIHPQQQHHHHPQQHQKQQQQQQLYVIGDVDDASDDDISDDVTVAKRSPWGQYEVNVGNLRQKIIRSKMFSNRQKHSTGQQGQSSSQPEAEGSPELAFATGYMTGWLKARAYLEEAGIEFPEVDGALQKEEDDDDDHPTHQFGKRTNKEQGGVDGRQTRLRSAHPVYLGMGQETANAALSTFASLLAEEEKRKNSEHPVRFIGKRQFAADE